MITISLVRHGEPEWISNGKAVDDPQLTSAGTAQAQSLGRRLAAEGIDAFYSSPMKRAIQTARAIADRCEVEPTVLPWMAEMGVPDFEGLPASDVDEYFGKLYARSLDEWWPGPPGGESFREFDARVRSGLEELLVSRHSFGLRTESDHRVWDCPEADYHLVLVAHAGSIGVMISYLLDLESVPWIYERFKLGEGRLCRLESTRIGNGIIWSMREFGIERS